MDWQIDVVGSVESTQDHVRHMAESGAPEGYVFQSLIQTGGRGRLGRDWVSPMGNLYLSALLRPKCSVDQAGQMAFVVALALSAAIDLYIDPKHHKTLKWPNDILVNGLKISGILLETNIENKNVNAVIIGTGVNIFSSPDGAVALNDVKDKDVFVNVFRDDYLAELAEFYSLWQEKGFAPIREAWLKQAHGLGESIQVNLPDQTLQGVFDGLDKDGTLLITVEGQQQRITAGDVHFG